MKSPVRIIETNRPAVFDWLVFILGFSMTYVLLYLPLRYLYLVEDYSSRQT